MELLRTVRRQPEAAKAWGTRLQDHIVSTFSPETITPLLLAALSDPAGDLAGRP